MKDSEVAALRDADLKIVFCSGCFVIFVKTIAQTSCFAANDIVQLRVPIWIAVEDGCAQSSLTQAFGIV